MADMTSLLGFSPEDLQRAMGLLGPQQADRDAANKQALIALGLGLMGARRGQEFGALGNAGMNALATQQAYLQNQIKQRQEALPQLMALRQMAMQNQSLQTMNRLLGQADQTQPGPSVDVPPGAVGGSGMGGGTAALFGNSSQPGPVTGPSTQVPVNPNLRKQLTDMNLARVAAGMPDMSAAIKARFPDIIPLRQGAGAYDPMTGKITPNPTAPPGYYYDVQQNAFIKVKNANEAEANAASVAKAVERAYEPPQSLVDATGTTVQPPGNRLSQMFGGGPLPFGVPNPNAGAAAGPGAAGPAASPPAGPMVVKQSPQIQATQEQVGKDVGEYRTKVLEAGDSARSQDARINEMQQAMNGFTPSRTLPLRADVASYAQDLPLVGRPLADMLVSNSKTALPSVTAFNKLATQMVAEQAKVFGSREAVQVVQMVRDAIPNAGMVNGAPQMIFNFMKGLNEWAKTRQNALVAWEKVHNGSPAGFRETWEAQNPPTKFTPPLDALAAIAGHGPDAGQPASQSTRTVVQTGTYNGKKVVKYSDGTVEYAK